jgi:hypothetical protein
LHSAFGKEPRTLTAAFAHMFLLPVWYLARFDGTIVGMAACADRETPSIRHRIVALPGYSSFILEAADTNRRALALYTGMGFAEVRRLKLWH